MEWNVFHWNIYWNERIFGASCHLIVRRILPARSDHTRKWPWFPAYSGTACSLASYSDPPPFHILLSPSLKLLLWRLLISFLLSNLPGPCLSYAQTIEWMCAGPIQSASLIYCHPQDAWRKCFCRVILKRNWPHVQLWRPGASAGVNYSCWKQKLWPEVVTFDGFLSISLSHPPVFQEQHTQSSQLRRGQGAES